MCRVSDWKLVSVYQSIRIYSLRVVIAAQVAYRHQYHVRPVQLMGLEDSTI